MLRTLVRGGAEGDKSTKEASFTGLIWTLSVSGRTPLFCDCLVQNTKLQESQQICNSHLSEHAHLRQEAHLESLEQKEHSITRPSFKPMLMLARCKKQTCKTVLSSHYTRVISGPLIMAMCLLYMSVKNSHYLPTPSFLLSR